MKQTYIKPSTEIIELDTNTLMMADSANTVDTELGGTPSHPDARGRRGSWGNLWE